MALQTKVGTFVLNTGTGNQSISGLGFTPKALLFFGNNSTAVGFNTGTAYACFGAATSSSSRFYVMNSFRSTVSGTYSYRAYSEALCYGFYHPTGSVVLAVDFVSLDGDGFTINITTTDGSARLVSYVALGGDSLSYATTTNANFGSNFAVPDIEDCGMEPDAWFAFSDKQTGSASAAQSTQAKMSIGSKGTMSKAGLFNRTPIISFGVGTYSNAAFPTTDTRSMFTTLAPTQQICFPSSGGTFDLRKHPTRTTGGPVPGLLWTTATEDFTNCRYRTLNLKNVQGSVAAVIQPTSPGDQSFVIGWQPRLVMFISGDSPTNGITDHYKLAVGFMDENGNQGCIYLFSRDNQSFAPGNLESISSSNCIELGLNSVGPAAAAANFVSMNSDGFTINWNTVDATARRCCYIAFREYEDVGTPNANIGLGS